MTRGRIRARQVVALFTAVVVFASSCFAPVSALTPAQKQVLSEGIYYFNTEVSADENFCGSSSSATIGGGAAIPEIYKYLLAKGLTNIQAIGIMANMQAESHFEPRLVEYGFPNSSGEISKAGQASSLDDNVPTASNSKGQPGYGLAQWSGGRKTNLANTASSKHVKGSDLQMQLDFLWGELSGSYLHSVLEPLKATTSLNDAVDIVVDHFEIPANKESKHKEREALGIALYQKYGSTPAPAADATAAAPAVATTFTDANGCSTVANGDVVQTALSYAWPTRGHGKNQADANPAYQVAMPKYNGSTGDDPFSDCGVFVSTVMISSGADPNYPKRGTTVQRDYLNKSSKYTEIYTSNTADLKPGDIFITDGHTYLYVGPQAGGYDSVGASLNGHVPEAAGQARFSDTYGPGGSTRHYQVFRLK